MARLSSPHYGGYTTLAVVNGSPQGPIIVVVVYEYDLIIIIDVVAFLPVERMASTP